MTERYKYEGLTLTPALFAELVVDLLPGQLVRRSQAISEVQAFHASHGGSPAVTNISSTAKKAFSNLVEDGRVERAGSVGFYRVTGAPSVTADSADDGRIDDPLDEGRLDRQFVYAYYLPTYMEAALARAATTWPHKIGMTTTTVPERLRSQVGTALPEQPVIARVFACEDAALLERAFHSVLSLRNRNVRDAPGNEWFLTNEDEIDEIAAFVGWTNSSADHADDADDPRPYR